MTFQQIKSFITEKIFKKTAASSTDVATAITSTIEETEARLNAKADLVDNKVPVSQLPSFAEDTNVVHKTGDETITGIKTFNKKLNLQFDQTQDTTAFNVFTKNQTNDYLQLGSATNDKNTFIPALITRSNTAAYPHNNGNGVYASIFISRSNDVAYPNGFGAGAGIFFDARDYDNAALTKRNLFAWGSSLKAYMWMSPDGNLNMTSGKVIKSSPAVASNDVVVKSQLDTKADLVNGKIPASQIPGTFDDVLEGTYMSATAFKDQNGNTYSPEGGKLYIDVNSNIPYRWTGTAYIATGSNLTLGETSSTAYRGDRGKIAYDHSQSTGNPHHTQIADITNLQTTLNGKAVDADVVHKTGDETVAGQKHFTNSLGIGLAPNTTSYLTMGTSSESVAQALFTPSTTDYTGNVAGMLWNKGMEFKFYDDQTHDVNRFIKLYNNEVLAGSSVRFLEISPRGDLQIGDEKVDGFIIDQALITALTGATFINNRATISVSGKTFKQGQMYDDGTYTYLAIADNTVRRW